MDSGVTRIGAPPGLPAVEWPFVSGREFSQIMAADATESINDKCSIGDLARELDVTPRAIRFYEDEGLLSPGRDGARRVYSKRDYVRLKLILRGKRLGFSLAEVREMLELYDSAPDERPQLEKFVAALSTRREASLNLLSLHQINVNVNVR
jgi:DNA-binding transcriptional MerR regulator